MKWLYFQCRSHRHCPRTPRSLYSTCMYVCMYTLPIIQRDKTNRSYFSIETKTQEKCKSANGVINTQTSFSRCADQYRVYPLLALRHAFTERGIMRTNESNLLFFV